MFTDTITLNSISVLDKLKYEITVLNYYDFGVSESINFPLASNASRTKSFKYKVPAYQYVKKLQLGIHYYQLDDILNIYINGKQYFSRNRNDTHCLNKDPYCVINEMNNYTFDFSLSSEDLEIVVQLVNLTYDGILTDAWISLKALY